MKKIVLDYLMSIVNKDKPRSEIQCQEIRYGLEAIYLNISKFIVFFIVNAILRNFITSLLFLCFFIPIKSASYGFHAKTSLQCWLMSGIGFVGLPLLTHHLYFNFYVKIIFIIYFILIFAACSPADTPKKPIISKKLRLKLKLSSLIIVFAYAILILANSRFTNVIILAMLFQSLLISPLTYFVFNTQYNNYLHYKVNNL